MSDGRSSSPPPCRLKFILARQEAKAVIFRRGPSKWVRLIFWDLETDRFQLGQWFHGTLDHRKSDLSPDGKLLGYFAATYQERDEKFLGTWTAISKPPWLTALAVWPIGDSWGGDISFLDNHAIKIQSGLAKTSLHPEFELHDLRVNYSEATDLWEQKMARNRWQVHVPDDHPRNFGKFFLLWEKSAGGLVLQRTGINDDAGVREPYSLRIPGGEVIHLPEVNCADFDLRGRLVLTTKGGKLGTGAVTGNREFKINEIADFNDQVPEPIESPESAHNW